jgi:ABC-type hemin transport system substrate-binding protein
MTPQRIICLTEETTEWLYLLGQSHRIVGISGYTVRPATRAAGEAAGQRLPERQDRQDLGACSPIA